LNNKVCGSPGPQLLFLAGETELKTEDISIALMKAQLSKKRLEWSKKKLVIPGKQDTRIYFGISISTGTLDSVSI
jgi:hypothetical protein